MRRGVGLVAVMLTAFVLGCSSGDAITIEVLYPASASGEQVIQSVPFRTLGLTSTTPSSARAGRRTGTISNRLKGRSPRWTSPRNCS